MAEHSTSSPVTLLSSDTSRNSANERSMFGALYVVATPIGNLDDISARAIEVLKSADVIAAEDTRHSARLLSHLNIRAQLIALHDHNERDRAEWLVERISAGERIAMVSDAGTPLISDPGYHLVAQLRDQGLPVIPIPGPCALVTALSAAGLATDRFRFEGFLPAKNVARRNVLESLLKESVTLVFYESPHRIQECLRDIASVFGERRIVLARELTKRFETFLQGDANTLLDRMAADPDQTKGEFVVMLEGNKSEEASGVDIDADVLLNALLDAAVGVKQAASVAAKVLGGKKQLWYERVQALKDAR